MEGADLCSSLRDGRCLMSAANRVFARLELLHTAAPKLQALVYDILPWRKVPESDARSVSSSILRSVLLVRGYWPFLVALLVQF